MFHEQILRASSIVFQYVISMIGKIENYAFLIETFLPLNIFIYRYVVIQRLVDLLAVNFFYPKWAHPYLPYYLKILAITLIMRSHVNVFGSLLYS